MHNASAMTLLEETLDGFLTLHKGATDLDAEALVQAGQFLLVEGHERAVNSGDRSKDVQIAKCLGDSLNAFGGVCSVASAVDVDVHGLAAILLDDFDCGDLRFCEHLHVYADDHIRSRPGQNCQVLASLSGRRWPPWRLL